MRLAPRCGRSRTSWDFTETLGIPFARWGAASFIVNSASFPRGWTPVARTVRYRFRTHETGYCSTIFVRPKAPPPDSTANHTNDAKNQNRMPNAERIFFIRHALRAGFAIEEIFQLTKIDRWFLVQIKEIVDFEEVLATAKN